MTKNVLKRFLSYMSILAVALTIAVVPDFVSDKGADKVFAAENVNEAGGSKNEGMIAVPAPGPVTIDGDLSEWDWSGRIKIFQYYYEIDTKSVESAAMYDDKYLYFASKFKDQSPLNNPINPITEAEWTWRGDGHQFRIWTDDKPIWLNVSYYEPTDQSAIFYTYFTKMNTWSDSTKVQYYTSSGSSVLDQVVSFAGTPMRIDKTAEIEWKKDDDGLGYVMEMKIPWTVLYKDQSRGGIPGGKFSLGIECKWTNDISKGTNSFSYSDNTQPGTTSIAIGDYEGWGDVIFSPAGNVEMRNYVVDLDTESAGSIHLYPKVPKNTKYLTLVMEDKSGNRIANIVSELEISDKNIIAEDADTYTVDVTWNGKALYDDYVKAGEYVISGITHEGVKVFLDYTAYNPGTPAWATSDGKGGWGADHCPPVSVASYGNQTFVGYVKAESGYGLIGIGEDGTKEWSIKRGAKFLAATEDYLYAIPDNDFYYNSEATGNTYIIRLDKNNGDIIPFVLNDEPRITELTIGTILSLNQTVMPEIMGFAAYGDELYVATAANNTSRLVPGGLLMNYTSCINVLDAESAEFKRRIAVPDVGQIAVSTDGKLYAVSGDKIISVNRETGRYSALPIELEEGMVLGALSVDKDGNVIVFDKGSDLQIKAYNPNTGAKVYTVGKKGGRALMGYYDETGFSHMVTNISADAQGHVWAVENWEYPRRVSCWNTDGTVYKDYIGTSGYQSAGTELHQSDPNLVYVGANEMTVDHTTKTTKMNRVLWVPDYSKNQAYFMEPMTHSLAQHCTLEVNGVEREYIFGQSVGAEAVIYMENDEGYFQPVCAMGTVGDFEVVEGSDFNAGGVESAIYFSNKEDLYRDRYLDVFDGIADNTFYIWNDINGDAAIQIEECEFNTTMQALNDGWGHRMTSDFRFILQSSKTDLQAGGVWMVSPTEITEDGVPRYSFTGFKHLDGVKTDGFNRHEAIILDGTNKLLIYSDNSGNTIEKHNGAWVVDIDTGAKQEWWYLNQYPGVHGSHSAPVGGKNGQIIGPVKCLGIINVNGEELFALRGNYGQDFFMTTDGYYIETVFNDGHRTGTNQTLPGEYMDPLEFAKIDFSQGSNTGECFSGSLVYHDDGIVRMGITAGGPCSIISRLEGLETIERIEKFNFKLTPEMIDEAKEYNKALESMATSMTIGDTAVEKNLVVNKVEFGSITIDANEGEWKELEGTTVSKAGVSEAAQVKLAHDGQNLYAMFYVNDRSPMANKGTDYAQLFKTGDAVDIQLSPDNNRSNTPGNNDMRIVISKYAGKPVAVLMQETSSTGRNQRLYASPVTNLYFDNVEIIKDAEVEIMSTEEGAYYVVEAKIPFSSIGADFKSGQLTTGDVGFITSDDAGTINLARIYLFNKDTGLVNDVPNEAKLAPGQWGTVEFK